MRHSLPIACLLAWALGCQPGELRRVGGEAPFLPADGGAAFDGALPSDPTDPVDPGDPTDPVDPVDPTDPGLPALYPYASTGAHCSGGTRGDYLVLSAEPPSCAAHAAALGTEDPARFVRIPLPGAPSFTTTQTLCAEGRCAPTTMTVELDGAGGRWSATVDGTPRGGTFTATACDYDAFLPPAAASPVTDLRIREVALFQGVKIPLARDGAALTPNAPVVAGREALVRVYVEPGSGYVPRETIARLTLGDGMPIEARLTVTAASSEGDGGSTYNLFVPGERIAPDTRFSLGIYDPSAACSGGSDTGGARFPTSGDTLLGARTMGGALRVVIVPVAYDADGSGRLPDTSTATMSAWRDAIYSLFPVEDLEVTVRATPLRWSGSIAANGSGWSSMLDACMAERNRDGVAPDTYYYCTFAPASSFRNFCSGGCVSGLGPVPSARDTYSRAAIGLGYTDSAGTFAHEIGHSLGRPHAPCGGASGAEASYPYTGGTIGSWGYDVLTRELKDPSRHTDIMGYCDAQWISDYNYANLFERIRTVKGARALTGPPRPYLSIVVEPDGSLTPGRTTSLPSPPDGEPMDAHWLAAGETGTTTDAVFLPVDHVDGGILFVALPTDPTDTLSLPGFGRVDLGGR